MEERSLGGNLSDAVRVGDTVRRGVDRRALGVGEVHPGVEAARTGAGRRLEAEVGAAEGLSLGTLDGPQEGQEAAGPVAGSGRRRRQQRQPVARRDAVVEGGVGVGPAAALYLSPPVKASPASSSSPNC